MSSVVYQYFKKNGSDNTSKANTTTHTQSVREHSELVLSEL